MKRLLCLLLPAIWLSACESDEVGGEAPVPADICISSDCSTKTVLLEIISAENIHFTPEGRLFVSGGENVYEITRDGAGEWHSTPIYDGTGNFTGLAQVGDVLYANGFGGQLYAARLTAQPQLAPIHQLSIGSPNGLVDGPEGELYAVNGPLSATSLPDPKIVRLKPDPSDPFKIVEETDWLSTGALTFPNGVQRRGRTLYYTASSVLPVALGAVLRVEIKPDGSAGEPETVGSFAALPDDFSLAGDQFLLAYYSNNQIALMNADGSIDETSALLSLENPSSVELGRPPLFNSGDVLVTEKGLIVLPPIPGYGSKLSVIRPN